MSEETLYDVERKTNNSCPYTYQEVTNEHLLVLQKEVSITNNDDNTITLTLSPTYDDTEPTQFDVGHVRPGINTHGDVYNSLHTVLEIIISTHGEKSAYDSIDNLQPGLYYKYTNASDQTHQNEATWKHFDVEEEYARYAHNLEQLTYDEFNEWVEEYRTNRGLAVRKIRNKIIEQNILHKHGWQAAQKLAVRHLRDMSDNQRKEERMKDPERYVKHYLERQGRFDGRTASSIAKTLKKKGLLTDELTDEDLEAL